MSSENILSIESNIKHRITGHDGLYSNRELINFIKEKQESENVERLYFCLKSTFDIDLSTLDKIKKIHFHSNSYIETDINIEKTRLPQNLEEIEITGGVSLSHGNFSDLFYGTEHIKSIVLGRVIENLDLEYLSNTVKTLELPSTIEPEKLENLPIFINTINFYTHNSEIIFALQHIDILKKTRKIKIKTIQLDNHSTLFSVSFI